jgi:hypothetical protein
MRTLAALLIAAVGLACASEPRPWKVTADNQRRFDQAHDACTKLTDDPAGFENCMTRRGLRREYWFGL